MPVPACCSASALCPAHRLTRSSTHAASPPSSATQSPEPSHADAEPFTLAPIPVPESPGRLAFSESIPVGYEQAPEPTQYGKERVIENPSLYSLSTLKPLGQIRDSFILAVNDEGLWIVDQHVAHERVLFEKILRERKTEQVQRQRLLMPLLIDLLPAQMVAFARIAARNSNATALKPNPSARAPSQSKPHPSASKAASSNR